MNVDLKRRAAAYRPCAPRQDELSEFGNWRAKLLTHLNPPHQFPTWIHKPKTPACKSCLQSFCPECRNLALDDDSEGACVCRECYRDGSYGVFGTPPLIEQARAVVAGTVGEKPTTGPGNTLTPPDRTVDNA